MERRQTRRRDYKEIIFDKAIMVDNKNFKKITIIKN